MKIKYFRLLWELVRLLNMVFVGVLALAYAYGCEFTASALALLGILWLAYQRNPYQIYLSDRVG